MYLWHAIYVYIDIVMVCNICLGRYAIMCIIFISAKILCSMLKLNTA